MFFPMFSYSIENNEDKASAIKEFFKFFKDNHALADFLYYLMYKPFHDISLPMFFKKKDPID